MKRSAFALGVVVAAGMMVLAPRVADACSQPCIDQPNAFEHKTIPSVSVLPLNTASSANVEVRRNGVNIPFGMQANANGLQDLIFDGPLEPGSYTITRAQVSCGNGEATAPFAIEAARPLPKTTGTLTSSMRFVAASRSLSSIEPAQKSECGGSAYDDASRNTYDRMIVDVELHPTQDLVPYLPVARFVQEHSWPSSNNSSSVTNAGQITANYKESIEIRCVNDRSSGELQPGKYHYSFAAQIVGSDTKLDIPAAALDIVVTCPTSLTNGTGHFDNAPSSAMPFPNQPADLPSGSGTGEASPSSSDTTFTCSASSGNHRSPLMAFAFAAIAALAIVRVRSPRKS